MDKYFMWIHYERLHNHNKAKHNKTVCIFLGIYCMGESIQSATPGPRFICIKCGCYAVKVGVSSSDIKQRHHVLTPALMCAHVCHHSNASKNIYNHWTSIGIVYLINTWSTTDNRPNCVPKIWNIAIHWLFPVQWCPYESRYYIIKAWAWFATHKCQAVFKTNVLIRRGYIRSAIHRYAEQCAMCIWFLCVAGVGIIWVCNYPNMP